MSEITLLQLLHDATKQRPVARRFTDALSAHSDVQDMDVRGEEEDGFRVVSLTPSPTIGITQDMLLEAFGEPTKAYFETHARPLHAVVIYSRVDGITLEFAFPAGSKSAAMIVLRAPIVLPEIKSTSPDWPIPNLSYVDDSE